MKMPSPGDSVEWTLLHAGKVYKHSGVLLEYFERGKRRTMYACILEGSSRKIVTAGRIKLSLRKHNVKEGKIIEMQKAGGAR